MTDYKDIGFTNKLMSETSILLKGGLRLDALQEDARVVDRSDITTERIKDSAVTGAKIADGAITGADLSGSIISGTHVADEAIDSIHLAGSSVDGTHIADEAIDSIHIAGSAVDGTHVADSAILAVNIGGSIIAGTHVGTNTIAATSIVEDSITSVQIGTFDFSEGSGTIGATAVTIGTSTQVSQIFDEDDLSSDSATALSTQQSIKKYVDDNSGGNADDGWVAAGETWTYASAADPTFTFTTPGDKTAKYSPGMKIKISQSTGGTKYFLITAVSFPDPNTLFTVYGGTDYNLENESISSPVYSVVAAPLLFPLEKDKWSVTTTDSSNRSQAAPTANTWYNPGSLNLTIPIGAWTVEYQAVLQCSGSATTSDVSAQSTFGTTTSSSLGAQWQAYNGVFDLNTSDPRVYGEVFKDELLTLTTRGTYHFNIRTDRGNMASVNIRGDLGQTKLIAISDYV